MEEFIEAWEKAMHKTSSYREWYLLASIYRMNKKGLTVLLDLIQKRLAE